MEEDNNEQNIYVSEQSNDINHSVPQQIKETEIIPQQTPIPIQNNPIQTQLTPTPTPTTHNPVLLVIQWLTYAFWGWTAIAIIVLTAMVSSYFLISKDVYSAIPYSLASVAVLLPISITCEILYNKKEQVKKIGGASIIMIIHAVIFALSFVGSLVTIILNLLNILIQTDTNPGTMTFIYTALVAAVFYAILFIRTILPEKIFKFRKFMIIALVAISLIMVIISILGPVVKSLTTKNDRLIEDNLSYVVDEISSYYSRNDILPNKLSDLESTNEKAKQLIDNSLVTYKKDSVDDNCFKDTYRISDSTNCLDQERPTAKYQLCVKYSESDEDDSRYMYNYSKPYSTDDEYETYVSTYNHPAGDVCYKLEVSSYGRILY